MHTLLIGYDLDAPGQDYTAIIARLKTFSWCHQLDSTWLVKAPHTASQMRDELKTLIDGSDELMVIEVTGDDWATWGFSEPASRWMKANI